MAIKIYSNVKNPLKNLAKRLKEVLAADTEFISSLGNGSSPATYPANQVTEDATHLFVTQSDKDNFNRITVTQTGHGFLTADLPLAVRKNSLGNWVRSLATINGSDASVEGLIESINGNTFTIVRSGALNVTGLLTETPYYLTADATGKNITSVEPLQVGDVWKQVFKTSTATKAEVQISDTVEVVEQVGYTQTQVNDLLANKLSKTGSDWQMVLKPIWRFRDDAVVIDNGNGTFNSSACIYKLTGGTANTDTLVHTFTIPGNLISNMGRYIITTMIECLGATTDQKTFSMKMNGTSVHGATITSVNRSFHYQSSLRNVNSLTKQMMAGEATSGSHLGYNSNSSGAVSFTAIDTTAEITVTLLLKLANVTNHIIIRAIDIEAIG